MLVHAAVVLAAACGRIGFEPAPPLDASRSGLGIAQNMAILPASEQALIMDDAVALGARWFAFDLDWNTIQGGGPTSFSWQLDDPVISGLLARGLQVMLRPSSTPAWARGTCTASKWCPPVNLSDYAAFVTAAVQRYSPLGVRHWQIWVEPNISNFWEPAPDPARYAQLLMTGYSAIKAVDPAATAITAGLVATATTNTRREPLEFLTSTYAAGAAGSFDALGHDPYCWANGTACPTQYDPIGGWSIMNDTPISLRSIMQANGDGDKRIWVTSFAGPSGAVLNEQQQAQMLTEAARLWADYDWAGPLFWNYYRDPVANPTDAFLSLGLVRFDYSPKPARDAFAAAAR